MANRAGGAGRGDALDTGAWCIATRFVEGVRGGLAGRPGGQEDRVRLLHAAPGVPTLSAAPPPLALPLFRNKDWVHGLSNCNRS